MDIDIVRCAPGIGTNHFEELEGYGSAHFERIFHRIGYAFLIGDRVLNMLHEEFEELAEQLYLGEERREMHEERRTDLSVEDEEDEWGFDLLRYDMEIDRISQEMANLNVAIEAHLRLFIGDFLLLPRNGYADVATRDRLHRIYCAGVSNVQRIPCIVCKPTN